MPKYMETAGQLKERVEELLRVLSTYLPDDGSIASVAVDIGHIINLAVRCAPRAVHHTVRKNIVSKAVGSYCKVQMIEMVDLISSKKYHQIDISPK